MMENLSSNKIKEIKKLQQKKYREETGLFIAEGEKTLEDIIKSKVEIIKIYSTKNIDNLCKNYTLISENDMKKISTTSSPCEILTIAKKREINTDNFKKLNNILLLDCIADPGNLGTIIRSASAFGIDGIILFGNCVEHYSPKVLRSCTGNFFKLPIITIHDKSCLKEYFPEHKFISTDLSKESDITIQKCSEINKKIIMFGSEAKGLQKDLIELSDFNLKLNMKKNVESLNLSVCVSIILYELSVL